MFQYSLYIGHNDGTTNAEIADAYRIIVDLADEAFDAYTAHLSEGRWRAVSENTTVLTIMGTEEVRGKVIDLAQRLKVTLNQEAIGYVETPAQVAFI